MNQILMLLGICVFSFNFWYFVSRWERIRQAEKQIRFDEACLAFHRQHGWCVYDCQEIIGIPIEGAEVIKLIALLSQDNKVIEVDEAKHYSSGGLGIWNPAAEVTFPNRVKDGVDVTIKFRRRVF